MDIIIAIVLLGGLSVAFGLILAFASKVFYVKTDPRLEQLNDCLPCANCGGCGFAGCSSYAEAVLKGETTIDKCASGHRIDCDPALTGKLVFRDQSH